ncbi:protein cordon-bleu isoform X3 [Cololabis saira]|uniref:protein cordon-bleu isoform X3 n=1 Tax=Cololabis saira TaxID=129043 RepID=UPI002AD4CCF1|nr:protein cordon-bleu isoform X3 [Cololabis saira]
MSSSRRRMKAHAPPPPPQPAPRHIFRNSDVGGTSAIEAKENILRPHMNLQLTLPKGNQLFITEDGSKALMDLLVELCSRYHLNPALHTLELQSPEGESLGFKPNALLGSLNVACVFLKEKVSEDKFTRKSAPKVPEKTVRLMVNYHGSQKAVLRVNPLVALQVLIPVICDKCELDPAHVLVLKDSVSRHELPLDKSLTELGVKELYVHDQSLVFQPKMASAPALNYPGNSISYSTTSLGRPEKKGILGIFQFSKRKSKTETSSLEMDDCDDKIIQNTENQSNGLSTVSGFSCVEHRPTTIGQSQSVIDIHRISPKAEAKKRRAPAPPGVPTPSMRPASFERNQVILGSESQQRKRKAPAPPPTPSTFMGDSDDTSVSAAPTPEGRSTETPTQVCHIKLAQSSPVADAPVVAQTVKPPPLIIAVQPSPATPAPSSPSLSSSTIDSLAVQDSSSDFSHSLDDSDADLDQAASYCSTSTLSSSVRVQPISKSSSDRNLESASNTLATTNQEATSEKSSRSATESDLNLKMDEVENNRHSAVAWPYSMQSSAASGHKPETEAFDGETLSLDSSSRSSSLPDQVYAASEDTTEAKDSGMVSPLSDTQPTSLNGSLRLNGRSGEKLKRPGRDVSSDSDEGCGTWGSIHRNTKSQGHLVNAYEEDSELTSQLHQTLADFDANLADHEEVISRKDAAYIMSTNSNDVPVSVVDMDVPVTAIDDVLQEYDCIVEEHVVKSLTNTEPSPSKGPGFCQKPNVEPQNKNNNAYTTAVTANKSNASAKKLTQSEQRSKPPENKCTAAQKEEKIIESNNKARRIGDAYNIKENKHTLAVKSNVDMQKDGKNAEIKKPEHPSKIQRSVFTGKDEELVRFNQSNSGLSTSHGKITRNVTSRFGMKTFTVVPPKPTVIHAPTTLSAATLTTGAIKIDDQGNMVMAGISRNKASRLTESRDNAVSPPLEKAKTFWSSNERQEKAASQRTGLNDKAEESVNGLHSSTSVGLGVSRPEYHSTTQSTVSKPVQMDQVNVLVGKEAKEAVQDDKVVRKEWAEVQSKVSVSKNVQQPRTNPALLPDSKKDLSFFKPSRRTSSQYVASAITKYAPKTSAKPSSIPNIPDYSASAAPAGLQGPGRSTQVNPLQSLPSSSSDNKENASTPTCNPPGSKRSMSYPEYMSHSLRQKDCEEVKLDRRRFEKNGVLNKEGSDTLDAAKNNYSQFGESTRTIAAANNNRDYIKHIRPRSPSPAKSSVPQPSSKPPTAHTTTSQGQISGLKHTAEDVNPSATASDGGESPGPLAVTLFGPVKKFKPVICRSVEKETSLHSSLMEAIQTNGGRDRLKKISASDSNDLKKESHVEEESERSTLLTAIRAQTNTSRLRKTKTEASHELEQLRKLTSEREKSADSSSCPPSMTCSSLVLTPPAPLGAAPPPPPPALPQGKPNVAAHPNPNNPTNPSLAREAMLEAIRSGSAAEGLKKVSVPTKTVHVNGRLGTIQVQAASSSNLRP